MAKPKQIDSLEILNEDDRIFKSWGTVEVVDKEDQLLPIDEFKKIMPTLMDRGGNITDRHSNKVIAKILNYEWLTKETPEGPKDGIYITGKVFKNYALDDMVWEGIKRGIYKGLSFGGMNHQLDTIFEKGKPIEVVKQLEGFEFALVPGMGNQEATMDEVNYLAKCDKIAKVYQDGEHGHLEIENRLSLIEKKIGLENEVSDDEEVSKTLTKTDYSLSLGSDKSESYLKNNNLNKSMVEDNLKKEEAVETPSTPAAPTNPMEEIKNMLAQILQAVQTPAAPVPAPAAPIIKEDDEEDKDKEKVDKEEKVTLPKTPEEETGPGKPAQGEQDDKVKFVEKKELEVMKNEIVAEIKKGLFNANAQTPRPGIQAVQGKEVVRPKSWGDVNKMIKERD